MSKYKIAILAGDGIGPEITDEAIKVLKVIEQRNNLELELMHTPFGASAYFSHGHPYPCLLYTSPSPRDRTRARMPSSA